ncbi:Tn7 transposase TnsA N-terminal domain-containing protein [Tunturiibacter empetritectus]
MHPAVRWFSEQPMKIRFIDETGVDQVYVPDFHIEFTSGRFLGRDVTRPWIVETKYRSDLAENWPKIRQKLRAGFREATRRNSQFHIVSEACLSCIPLTNAKFVRPFLNSDLSAAMLDEVVAALRSAGRTTVRAFLTSQTWNYHTVDPRQVIWSAIAKRMISSDFEMPFGPETTIWVR